MISHFQQEPSALSKRAKINPTTRVFIALFLGIFFGFVLGEKAIHLKFLGDLFIKAVSMTVIPVVFVSMVCGVISMKDPIKMGRIAIKTLSVYFLTMAGATSMALFISTQVFSPGKGLKIQALSVSDQETIITKPMNFIETLVGMVPSNVFTSFLEGNIIQLIVFASLIGIAINLTGKHSRPLEEFFNGLMPVVFKLVELVMKIAPIGVFGLMAVVTGTQGIDVLKALLSVVFVIFVSMAAIVTFIYGGGLLVLGRMNPIPFFKKMIPVQTLAFSTTSSAATLPLNMKVGEERLGLSKGIVSFILPLGATLNMNGLSAYMGVVAVFATNIYGIEFGLKEMLQVVLTSTIAAIGCAGVPAAGLIVMPVVLSCVGVPLKIIGVMAAVDRIIDMLCTTINITGDTFAAVLVAKSENEISLKQYQEK
ncbi:MAG: dicarboxylate/amino acid:cation symporter [Oligoflexales bacterium]